jgi:hypothetical protein
MQNVSGVFSVPIFLVAGFILAGCGGGNSNSSQVVYTAIFEAGSSSTRLSFYKVIPAKGGYPQISKLFENEYRDSGIANFLNGNGTIELVDTAGVDTLPGGVRPANCIGGAVQNSGQQVRIAGLAAADVGPCVLAPLLAAQDAQLAATQVTRTQVKTELFATAAMRTEDDRNGGGHTTAQILDYYQTMKSHVAGMSYATGEYKTINGNSEEGVWAWVDLNDYYYNAFGGNATVSPSAQFPVGEFDVGNSSTQIAFPTNTAPDDAANVYRVSINGKTFNVNSQSILGLGAADARKYVRAFGYNNNDGGADCLSATATASNTAEDSGIALYPNVAIAGYPFPSNGNLATPWTMVSSSGLLLIGSANFDSSSCGIKYDTVISQVISLSRNSHGTDNEGAVATLPSLKAILETGNSPFVGVGNFYDTADDLGIAASTNFDPSTFTQDLQDYCLASVPPNFPSQQVCANGTFMNTFLFGSSGLFTSSNAVFSGVLPSKQNGNAVLSWTRGYLLLKYAN